MSGDTPAALRRYGGLWREIIDSNVRAGLYFFSDNTMRGFNSVLCGQPLRSLANPDLVYFVTGERMETTMPLQYTVRSIDLTTGETDYVGEFQQHRTQYKAIQAMRIAAAATTAELYGREQKDEEPS